jgi:hypothetical protein
MLLVAAGMIVRLLFDNSVITSKLYYMLSPRLHTENSIKHILKKTRWTMAIFNLNDLDVSWYRFKRLTRPTKISMAKVIHQLINTNRQNNLHQGTSIIYVPAANLQKKLSHICWHVLTLEW